MRALNLPTYSFKIKHEGEVNYIFDEWRRKYVKLTPEEWVRQHFIRFLVEEQGYPASLIALESGFTRHKMAMRTDALVYNRKGKPVMIIEFKAHSVAINQKVVEQAARYNEEYKLKYLAISNGMQHFCFKIDHEKHQFMALKSIPGFDLLDR